jgi:dipeptidase
MLPVKSIVVASIICNVKLAFACTAIAVGKDASASGFPMIGHSEDAGPMANDVRLIRVPRKSWPVGSKRYLYHWQNGYPRVVSTQLPAADYAPVGDEALTPVIGDIPQVAETWAYWDTLYGVQNEWGLSIGESTCTARTVGWPSNLPHGYNGAGIEDLSKIALERCKTARCAVETMGKIAVEKGFYSADSGDPAQPAYGGSSECLLLGDASPGEAWIFNVMTGKNNASAIWAAERVPDDHVAAVGNSFTIRKMNLSDSHNFLYSPKVSALAEEMGWWSSKEESSPDLFDFFGAYGYTPTDMNDHNLFKYYSGRRMWRVFSLLSPKEGGKLDPITGNLPHTKDPYPNSVRAPRRSISLKMVMEVYRDHYEGTPYDLTKGVSAGPFGNPNRNPAPPGVEGLWERALSMYRTSWSFILEAKPQGRSTTWFGWDAAHGTAYLPFFGAVTDSAP